ncbi:MAG: heme lyase CcmF/NrfE family subunit [Myxococcaceae bacterium]
MNSSLGYALVLAALGSAIFGAVVGLWTGMTRRESALPWVQRAVYAFAFFMAASNGVMVYALLTHDFSVKYVAQVGSLSTPWVFTVVSLWSALDGSILFWGFIMGLYLFAFAWIYRKEYGRYMQLSLGMMCAVGVFFAFLIAGPANPFGHVPNPMSDGPGPNPLLQNHVLMIVHPPMLYFGFVGMVVPFGIATGALLRGELGDSWLVPLRKWMLIPWIFLTVGIILGSWWAYAVLGWGGYWAWDPVENASLLPWLTATAFMHSTMVLERKKMLKLWTLALAMASFILTIVGTFMTRSGVFNSVHAFTQSEIGPTFLAFIAILLIFSIALLSMRGRLLMAESSLDSPLSRETAVLVNNLVFVAITFVVFLGTSFPLVTEALQGKRISVGEPYFNKMALPGGLLVLFMMGVGPVLPWGEANLSSVRRQLLVPVGAALLTAAACLAYGLTGAMAITTFALGAFVTVITLRELLLPARQRMTQHQEGALAAVFRSASRARRRFGGYVVHLGIVMIIVGIAASSAYKVHETATLGVGQSMALGDYQLRFDGMTSGVEPRREWKAAEITIVSPSGKSESLKGMDGPRMNYYQMSSEPVGSPAVQAKFFKDVYVTLLAFDAERNTASFNAWIFPLVGWIWYALPILVLGTLIALWPQRKTALAAETSSPAAGAPPPAAAPGLSSGSST